MAKSKLIVCKSCGAEIAKSAKACPKCGAKNKRVPIAVWVFVAFIALGALAGGGDDTEASKPTVSELAASSSVETITATPEPVEPEPVVIEYTAYTVDQLYEDLDSNAMRAEKTHKDQHVELTAKLSTIDNKGKYIYIDSLNYYDWLKSVKCYLTDDVQKDQLMEMSEGDRITVRGQIKDVSETFGYTLDIDEFVIK